MDYTPREMVGTKRKGSRNICGLDPKTICTSRVERLNGTQQVAAIGKAALPEDGHYVAA